MKTLAIVSEGVTDQIVLEKLLFECIEFQCDDPEFNYAQPRRDLTHSHTAPHGGWNLVLEYCETSLLDALQTNDFVVIQIDTDCGDDPGYNLDIAPSGVEKDSIQLVKDAITIISERIGSKILCDHGERLIFAVSVHSIESWLVFCLFSEIRKNNAFSSLRKKLDWKRFGKNAEDYQKLASMLKLKKFKNNLTSERSLMCFLNDFATKFPNATVKTGSDS